MQDFFDFEEIIKNIFQQKKIVPNRSAWIEIITDENNEIFVKIDKRGNSRDIFLMTLGYHTDKDIELAFKGKDLAKAYIMNLAEKDVIKTADVYIDVYKKLRR